MSARVLKFTDLSIATNIILLFLIFFSWILGRSRSCGRRGRLKPFERLWLAIWCMVRDPELVGIFEESVVRVPTGKAQL